MLKIKISTRDLLVIFDWINILKNKISNRYILLIRLKIKISTRDLLVIFDWVNILKNKISTRDLLVIFDWINTELANYA